jgi:hypothetical protein
MERPLHPPTSLLHPHDAHTPSLLPFFFYFTSTITGEMREREREKKRADPSSGGLLIPRQVVVPGPGRQPARPPRRRVGPGRARWWRRQRCVPSSLIGGGYWQQRNGALQSYPHCRASRTRASIHHSHPSSSYFWRLSFVFLTLSSSSVVSIRRLKFIEIFFDNVSTKCAHHFLSTGAHPSFDIIQPIEIRGKSIAFQMCPPKNSSQIGAVMLLRRAVAVTELGRRDLIHNSEVVCVCV